MVSLEAYLTFCVALFGLLFGSFLNVVIARVPAGESIVTPPSKCPKCGHQIRWYENIPVFSWLALRGQCSGCKSPISPRYVLVELLTGALFLACAVRFGFGDQLASALVFVLLIVPLVFIDAEHWILPLEIMLPGTLAGVLLQAPRGGEAVASALLGAVAGYALFRALEWGGWLILRKEAMGAGDKFLVAMIGAFLGPKALLGLLVLSSLQASVWGVTALLLTGRAGPKTEAGGDEAPEQPRTFQASFLAAGLPWWKRVLLFPVTVFWQEVPDPLISTDETGNEVDLWKPGVTSLPYGPWLGLAALQILLLGPQMAALAHGTAFAPMLMLMFGGAS